MSLGTHIYTIDYEFGIARLFTRSDDWENRFYHLANQCFGIRKSIGKVRFLEKGTGMLEYGYEKLEHNSDVIIWNENGKKIKSEWDD